MKLFRPTLATFAALTAGLAHADPPTPVQAPISGQGTIVPGAAPVNRGVNVAATIVEQDLKKAFPNAKVETRTEPGPFGTTIVVGSVPGAYPGSGVARVVIDNETGVLYGARGEKTLADFARLRGWLAKPPANDELVGFVNTALFDGVAIMDSKIPAKVTAGKQGLVIEIVRRFMPSNAGETVTVTLPAEGKETVTREPL